mgnify:CR=1 FL=1
MKQTAILLLLALTLISCGQVKAPVQTPEQRWESEILREEAQNTNLSDARENYDEICGALRDEYLSHTQEAWSYQIVTELQSEWSGACLLWYYNSNGSGIYAYTLYDLTRNETLGELSCEPEYLVEHNIMGECSPEALQNLKMEYEYLLETHRGI